MGEHTGGRTLKTTETSFRILRLILEHDGLTLAELDGMIDRPKSSVLSHLNTLHEGRYLVRSDGVYNVSFRLVLLGERARRRYPMSGVVEDVVDQLAARTGEEANFTIFEHGRLLMFYGSSGPASTTEDDVSYRTEYYLHNTAAGKAILAELDRERVERVLERWGLPQESEGTITDRDALFEELDTIAARGIGTVDEEFAPGLVAVGAPVYQPDGSILGGLSVGGPKYRIDMNRINTDIADALVEAVSTLESAFQT